MITIVRANEKNSELLAHIGKISFIESHGISASPENINTYVAENYNEDVFNKELSDLKNIYHIIYHNNCPAGYSQIVLNSDHSNIKIKNATKLDRLYLLKEYYGLKLGYELLKFNIELSQTNKQTGMWLFVWKENQQAVRFYEKTGFNIVGSHDFKLTDTHSNPNHQMLLRY
ncbi:MAG: GNAT family N-acetyltransferase [Ignavibacteria bacterium]